MSKYYSKKTHANGVLFDSKKEADRFIELNVLQKIGAITGLKTQVPFVLIPAQYAPDTINTKGKAKRGKIIERAVEYVADFVYTDKSGEIVVEDVKGYRKGTAYAVFVIKRKLMLYVHGIKIKEI